MSYIRNKAIEGLRAGEIFSISRTFTEEDVLQFAENSRDYNPVHFDERFAKLKNFTGPVCQGLLVASLVTEIGGQIGWLASGMDFKFLKLYFGDSIRCDFRITEIGNGGRARAEAVFTNEDQVTVLVGVVTGFLPGDKEKQGHRQSHGVGHHLPGRAQSQHAQARCRGARSGSGQAHLVGEPVDAALERGLARLLLLDQLANSRRLGAGAGGRDDAARPARSHASRGSPR